MSLQDEAELIRLAKGLNEAADRGDRTALEALIADEYVSTGTGNVWGSFGEFGDKSSAVARFSAAPAPDLAAGTTLSNERVTVSGDTGVTTYLIVDRWSDAEGHHAIECWVTDVWVRRNGSWQLLATHESVVSENHQAREE
jgi:hypothetical protein